MKKIFVMAVMAVCTLAVSAQGEKGSISIMPKVGINLATATGDDAKDAKTKVDVVVGAAAQYMVTDKLGIEAGLLYSGQGYKLDGPGNVKANVGYLNVPIVANYYLFEGFAVKAGLQPGFKTSAKWKFDGGSEDIDNAAGFDLSIPVGASYEYKNIVLDARYNFGLTNAAKKEDGYQPKIKNSVIQVTLGYRFSL